MRIERILPVAFGLACLAACGQPAPPAPQIRSVRAITVERRVASEPVVLTGQVRAREEINLAFRIDGMLIERPVALGDRIAVGSLVARLDSRNEQNALQGAEADITAAQAALSQAEKRQAFQQLQTAQAQLDSAQARRRTSESRLKYTELESEISGIVTAKGAEPGEFVRSGQMIIKVAREDLKDAVFGVPAQLALSRQITPDVIIRVRLVDNPNIKTIGRIREVSPQADPVTRLFSVMVGLDDPPPEFFLGVTVSGSISFDTTPVMTLPLTAVIESDGKPSVWVVDPASNTVTLRPVEILR